MWIQIGFRVKVRIFKSLKKHLQNITKLNIAYQHWCSPVNWLVTITLIKKNLRNKLLKFLNKSGIDARAMIKPVHQAYHFKNSFSDNNFKNSIDVSNNSIHLPSFTHINESEIRFICNKVQSFFDRKHKSN